MAINWDEIYGTKTSGFVGPVKRQVTVKPVAKKQGINWDEVYKQEAPKPPTNKFGVDVSNRPFNPLNPNNILNEKQPETSVLKNLWPGLKTGLTETATSALSAWNKLQEKRRADELKLANVNRKIDKKPAYGNYDELSADSPVLKTLNRPGVQSFVKKVGESSEDLGLKFYAKQVTKFVPHDQKKEAYQKTLEALQEAKNDPNNGKVKKILYGLQSALPQTAIGVMLNIIPTLVTRGRDKGMVGKTLSGTYYGAISANEQLQEDGQITSPGNIAIDVFGDQLLGKSLESLFKAPAKSMLREMIKNFGVEGGTEVAQSFAKFGNDYRNARTEEERQAVMARAKQYAKEEMLTEFAVGGISGAAITGGLSIPGSSAGNTTNTAVGPAVPEEKEVPPSTDAKPQFPLTRKSVDSVVRRETPNVSQEAPKTEFPLTRPVDSVVAPVKAEPEAPAFPTTRAEVTAPKEVEKVEKPSEKSTVNADPLITEARKYKSAEEFVKAQGKENVRYQSGSMSFGTSDGKLYIQDVNGKTIVDESSIDPTLVSEWNKAQLNLEKAKGTGVENVIKARNAVKEAEHKIIVQQNLQDSAHRLNRSTGEIKKADGSIYRTSETARNSDPNFMGDRNKANKAGTTADPLIQEARKYKSAEEFVDSQWNRGMPNDIVTKFLNNTEDSKRFTKLLEDQKTSEAIARNALKEITVLENRYRGKKNAKLTEADKTNLENQYQEHQKVVSTHLENYGGFDTKRGYMDGEGKLFKAIDFDAYTNAKSQLTDIWNKANKPEPKKATVATKPEPKKTTPVSKPSPKKPLPVARKVEPNPKQKKSSMLESRVAQRLAEDNEYLRTQDPVTYKALNLRSGIRVASELVVNNKKKAYRVAMGVENEPEGTTRAQVATALYVQAEAEGNNKLFSQLVVNLSLAATRAGQFLVSLKGSVADHSLAYYTKKVLAARLEQLGTSYLGNLQDTALDVFSKDKASHGRAIERGRAVLNQEVNEALKKIDKEKVLDINEAQKLIDSLKC